MKVHLDEGWPWEGMLSHGGVSSPLPLVAISCMTPALFDED